MRDEELARMMREHGYDVTDGPIGQPVHPIGQHAQPGMMPCAGCRGEGAGTTRGALGTVGAWGRSGADSLSAADIVSKAAEQAESILARFGRGLPAIGASQVLGDSLRSDIAGIMHLTANTKTGEASLSVHGYSVTVIPSGNGFTYSIGSEADTRRGIDGVARHTGSAATVLGHTVLVGESLEPLLGSKHPFPPPPWGPPFWPIEPDPADVPPGEGVSPRHGGGGSDARPGGGSGAHPGLGGGAPLPETLEGLDRRLREAKDAIEGGNLFEALQFLLDLWTAYMDWFEWFFFGTGPDSLHGLTLTGKGDRDRALRVLLCIVSGLVFLVFAAEISEAKDVCMAALTARHVAGVVICALVALLILAALIWFCLEQEE